MLSDAHLRATLQECLTHDSFGRLHESLGPDAPDSPKVALVVPSDEKPRETRTGRWKTTGWMKRTPNRRMA
jgi:hypothetical protein